MGFLSDVFDFFFGWLVPEQPTPLPPGAELTKAATDAAIPKIYGKVEKHNGIIIFKKTNDADSDDIKNDLLHVIIVWSEAAVSIDEVYLDDIPASSDNEVFKHSDGTRVVHVRNFPNGMAGYYDPLLAAAGWSNTDTCDGKACSYIRLEYHSGENAMNAEPKYSADITGTSYSNPAQILQDYLTNPIYGKGESLSRLNTAAFAAAQALCDSQVEEVTGGGVYRPLFTCNVALDTSQTVLDNVNTILKSMRAWLPVLNGKLTPIIEKDDPPVSLEITQDDILELGPIKNSNKKNRYNRVVVKYFEPGANATQQEAIYPPKDSQIETDWLAEDNGIVLEKSVELKTCRNYYEALEFAKSYAEVSREQLRTTVRLPGWATLFEVGDIVKVSHDFPGWNQKLFRIEKTVEEFEEVILSLREHQPYIYDFYGQGNKPSIPDTTLDTSPPAAPTNLQVTELASETYKIQLSWDGTAQRYDYQLLTSTDDVLDAGTLARKVKDFSGLPAGQYKFRVRSVGGLGRVSQWSSTLVFTLTAPVAPTVTLKTYALSIEVIPGYAGNATPVGTIFELELGTTTNQVEATNYGKATAWTVTGLSSSTIYYIWVRAINGLGTSSWTSVNTTTTADGQAILDLIGQDISNQILPDVIDATNANMQATVDATLVDYSTTVEVNQLISDAVDTVNSGVSEDPRAAIIAHINSIWDSAKRRAEIVKNEYAIETESEARAIEFNSLTARIDGNDASISTLNTAVANEASARATAISLVNARVDTAEASILTVSEAVTTETNARATAISALQAEVGDNSAAITSTSIALANETSARTTAITALQAEVDGNAASITNVSDALATETTTRASQVTSLQAADAAQVSRLDQAEAGIAGNASAISAVEGTVNNPTTGVAATYSLLQAVKTTADGNALSITNLNSSVGTAQNTANSALTLAATADGKANDNASSIATLTSSVSGAQGTANSALNLATVIDDSLDEYRAAAQLKVDVNGNVGFIQLDATPTASQIKFQSGQVFFLDNLGNPRIYFDNTAGKYKFIGEIDGSSFFASGGGKKIRIDPTASNQLWFGPDGVAEVSDNAHIAFGSTGVVINGGGISGATVTGGLIRTASGTGWRVEQDINGIWAGQGTRTDANADFYVKPGGLGKIKRGWIEGVLMMQKVAVSSSRTVTVTGHESEGNPVTLIATVDYRWNYLQANPETSAPRSLSWTLKRDGTTIASGTKQVNRLEIYEPGVGYRYYEKLDVPIQRQDTYAVAGTRSYTFEIAQVTGTGVTYETTISTSENLVG